jgi:hypothetical protein
LDVAREADPDRVLALLAENPEAALLREVLHHERPVGDAVEPEKDRAGRRIPTPGKRHPLSIVHEELLEALDRVLVAAAGRERLWRKRAF